MRSYLCCLLLLFSLGLFAQEFPIRQSYNLYLSKFSFSCPDGEIVFWVDNPSSHQDVYAQKISLTGESLWQEEILISGDPEDQVILGGVPTSDGSYILLLGDSGVSSISRLSLQKINSNGALLWPGGGVVHQTDYLHLVSACLVANSCGGAFVVYTTEENNSVVLGQSYNATGSPLWENDTVLSSHTGTIELEQAISDGLDGMILNCRKMIDSTPQNHLRRVSSAGHSIGPDPLVNPNLFPDKLFSIDQSDNGHFVLWQTNDLENRIRFRKIDNLGSLQGVSCSYYDFPDGFESWESKLTPTPDGGLGILWTGWRLARTSFKLFKLDTLFNQDWVINLECPDSLATYYAARAVVKPHLGGNIWLSWSQMFPDYSTHTMTQLISPEGQTCWDNGGIQMDSVGRTALIVPREDRALYICYNSHEGDTQIRNQILSVTGTAYLPESGGLLAQRLYGGVDQHQMLPVGDRFFVIWEEKYNERGFCFQILDQAHDILLEPEGRVLGSYNRLIDWTQVSNSSIALLLEKNMFDGEGTRRYLQVIDANGNCLFPDPGFVTNVFADHCLYSLGGDIFLSWKQGSEDHQNAEIRAQRFSEGVACWGENGRLLLSNPYNTGSLRNFGFTGRYLIWGKEHSWSARVLGFDSEGYPDPAWEPGGEALVPHEGLDFIQEVIDFGCEGEDLIVLLKTTTPMNYEESISLQRINPQGQRLWSDQGYPVSSSDNPITILDIHYANETSYLFTNSEDPAQRLLLQRVNAAGAAVFPGQGREIHSGLHDCTSARLFHFADGNWLCAWSETDGIDPNNRDLFYRLLSAEGLPLGTEPGIICEARYPQDFPAGAVIGNNLLIAWKDCRNGVQPVERVFGFPGLWARYLTSQGLAGEDPLASPPSITLKPNYPNPFNPSTTIPFSLETSGEASLKIYNIRGQLVRHLLKDEYLRAGDHVIVWDGRDDDLKHVSSGVYIYCLSVGGHHSSRRMVMVK